MRSGSSQTALPRRYWHLWQATAASSVGDGLTLVALPLLATSFTTQPGLVAGVLVMRWLPWLLLALPAGVVADRMPRRTILGLVEAARMVTLAILALGLAAGGLSLAALYGIAFVLGALETLFSAASVAALPSIVAIDDLDRANGYMFAAQSAGLTVVGPALGGVLFAVAAALPFALDAVSFAASAGLLLLAVPLVRAPNCAGRSVTADLTEGVRWFVGSPVLRSLTIFTAGLALCQSMVLGVLVLFGLQVLHLSRSGYGLFLATLALGQILGGVYAARIKQRLGAGRALVACALVAALGYLTAAVTATVLGAGIGLAAEAVAVAVGNVVGLSLRQAIVPGDMLGRVGNAARMCIYGAVPVGGLVGGLVAGTAGLRAPLFVACGIQVALVVFLGRRLCASVSPANGAEPVIDLTAAPVAAAMSVDAGSR